MAIAVGQVIVYDDLVDVVIETIISSAQNIDSWKNVPAQFKAGYSRTITKTITVTPYNDHRHGSYHPPVNYTGRTTLTMNDNYCQLVTQAIVREQFAQFLAERGLTWKKGTIMTLRGILNFIVNAASFIRSRLILVGMSDTSTVCVMYNSGSVSYSAVTDEYESMTEDAYYSQEMQDFLTALNNTSRLRVLKYNVAVSCCSSSSSSSSSSCSSSSSSSSSSSVFIAYMKI